MESGNYWQTLGSRRMRRRGVLGTAAAGAGLAIAGCGDDDEAPKPTQQPPSGGGGSASPAAASPTAVDLSKLSDDEFYKALPADLPKTWKDEDIKPGGRMVRIFNRQGNWDIHANRTGATAEQTTSVYSKLIRFSCRQGMKSNLIPELEADLATKWERPDDATMVFTLAPNIRFQNLDPLNGRALTVADIQFSFERGKTFAASAWKGEFAIVERIEDAGNNQVRLKFAKPEPIAEQYLTAFSMGIVPPEIGSNPDTAKTKMVGTGPMQVKSFTPNVELVFDKHPSFFKKDAQGRQKPYVDGVTYPFVADLANARAQFETGRADSAYSEVELVDFENIRDLQRRVPRTQFQFFPSAAAAWSLAGHVNKAPWSDPRVRRAFSLMMPRDAIAKAFWKGWGLYAPFSTWPTLFDAAPTLDQLGPNFKYNLAEAKALLEAAGVGTGLTLDVEVYPLTYHPKVAVLLQEDAAKIGVKLNLVQATDTIAHFARIAQKQWKDLTFYGRGLDFVDPAATTRSYVTGHSANALDVSDPEWDGLYARLQTASGDARKQVAKQMWDRQVNQMYDVPFPGPYTIRAFGPRMRNFVSTTWASDTGRGVGQWDSVWLGPPA